MTTIVSGLGAVDGGGARAKLAALMDRIGLDTSLSRLGAATTDERVELAAAVNTQRLGNNPVAFSAEELANLVAGLP
jgi:alcohol dehydrogenase class IV